MTILAIDPGTSESAFIVWDGRRSYRSGFVPNAQMLDIVRQAKDVEESAGSPAIECVAIEMVACYGMPVGREVFETCLLIGRMIEICERAGMPVRLVYRKDVKIHLCGSMKAKDGNIRQALIDKHGAPGTKKQPGPTYGISGHLWSALAVADYAMTTTTPRGTADKL